MKIDNSWAWAAWRDIARILESAIVVGGVSQLKVDFSRRTSLGVHYWEPIFDIAAIISEKGNFVDHSEMSSKGKKLA